MIQIALLLFGLLIFTVLRHMFRHRSIYLAVFRLLSGLANSGQTAAFGDRRTPNYGVKEKRIVTCPYCGSAPEVTGDPCSNCRRTI